MTRILHLSDLHFGRERPDLLRPLIEAVNRLAPDLVAISGDLTQRARPGQYRAAQTFIGALEPDVLCVPGNHDTPLHNLAERVFAPWRRYRHYIGETLEPEWHSGAVAVHGVNTVEPLFHQRGHIRRSAVRRLCGAAERAPDRMHVVVGHHPLEHLPDTRKRLARGAEKALATLAGCGTDVILCGHLHLSRIAPFRAYGGLLLVQAGTGLSTRGRGEPNDFNLLSFDATSVRIDRFTARDDASGFDLAGTQGFRKPGEAWIAAV